MNFQEEKNQPLELCLSMNSICRINLKHANLNATIELCHIHMYLYI